MSRKRTKIKPKRTRFWTHDVYRYLCTGYQDRFERFEQFDVRDSYNDFGRCLIFYLQNGDKRSYYWRNEKELKRIIKQINKGWFA